MAFYFKLQVKQRFFFDNIHAQFMNSITNFNSFFGHYSLLYSMSHPETGNSSFIVNLSQQQKQIIDLNLPKNYSLQPIHTIHHSIKNTHQKKFNIQIKQQNIVEKVHQEQKKRRIKSYQNIQPDQIKTFGHKNDQLSKISHIVKKLKKHDSAWPFRLPVDSKVLEIPNYHQIVLLPMDLHTIQEKIKTQKYEHHSQIQRDLNQMFLNSYKFNTKDSEYFQATLKLQQYYHSLLNQASLSQSKKQPKKKQQIQLNRNSQNQKTSQISQFQKDLTNLIKKSNELTKQKKIRQKHLYISSHDGQISLKQKRQLAQQIKTLEETHLGRIIQIIKSSKDFKEKQIKETNQNKSEIKDQEVFNFDVQKLDHKTFREVQNYVKLQKNSVSHQKQESILQSENIYSFQ